MKNQNFNKLGLYYMSTNKKISFPNMFTQAELKIYRKQLTCN